MFSHGEPAQIIAISRKLGDGLQLHVRIARPFGDVGIDDVGQVDEIRKDAEFYWVTVRYPEALAPYIVRKGSVAVDGISLTVTSVVGATFSIAVIPYTWEHTVLGSKRLGDAVNLEVDVLAKYVAKFVSHEPPER